MNDRELAMAELRSLVQPDSSPCLTPDELEDVLDRFCRATIWESGKAFDVGEVVLPTVRNGHRYRVVKAGTTAASEPSWPVNNPWYLGQTITRQVNDGTVTFEDDGADYNNVYDVRGAAYACWNIKTAKAVTLFNTPGIGIEAIYQHCKEMRSQFESVLIA
jgi:hypothetical protein